jgi:hypothetical protein
MAMLAGCGATQQAAETVTVTAPSRTPVTTVTSPAPAKPEHRRSKPRRQPAVPAGRKACDANITVKTATTSCAFGENVFYAFWMAREQGDDAFNAYSPVSEQSYAMHCTTGATVVCRAGDGGEVRFSRTAIEAYDADQAARYEATHDVGPADEPPTAPNDERGGPRATPDTGECDSSYEGECLDPDAIDYDCEGGSGDGPEYAGLVQVVGDDHYDLDRDGDGTGCDI